MKQVTTSGIILKRIEYGEADRILTVLTPEHGKLSLLAKGVRKSKSKLAGGLELFTVADITFVEGKSSMHTIIATKLQTYHSNIPKHLDRVMLGYEVLRVMYKETLQDSEPAYYELTRTIFVALDNEEIDLSLIHVWFILQLLQITGSGINIEKPLNAAIFDEESNYEFSYDDMAFFEIKSDGAGGITPKQIKFLKVVAHAPSPVHAMRISGAAHLASSVESMLATIMKLHRA